MTVMLYGLAEIRMEIRLLEVVAQLMILRTTSFCTTNRIFSAVPDLVSLTRGSFPNPVHALGCPIDSVLTHG